MIVKIKNGAKAHEIAMIFFGELYHCLDPFGRGPFTKAEDNATTGPQKAS